MPKKRQELLWNAWDNITQRCPGMKYRIAPYAIQELIAWLTLMQGRYAQALAGLREAERHGQRCTRAIRYNEIAFSVCSQLIDRASERWSVADWHTAVGLAEPAIKRIEYSPNARGKVDSTVTAAEDAANGTDVVRDGTDIQHGSKARGNKGG